jgi:hypothetical protein
MSYSRKNPAWDRLQRSAADGERNEVVLLARDLHAAYPSRTWGQCIAEAERLHAEKAREP